MPNNRKIIKYEKSLGQNINLIYVYVKCVEINLVYFLTYKLCLLATLDMKLFY